VLLTKFTTSNVPVWDAWVSSTAWAGMWLLARRKLENWTLLNLSNLFAVPLLCYKHLIMFAVLTLILFVVAIFGFFEWRDIWKKEQAAQPILTT
jgi:nicotinamide mononucleotide transporter